MDPSPTPPNNPESAPPPAVEPTPSSAPTRPDITKRVLAKLVDGFIAAILFWVANLIIPGYFIGSLVGAFLAAAYWMVCDGLDVDFMKQRSIGKKLMGLNVVRLGGGTMDVEASARRNWMFALSWFYYPAGWILSLVISLAVLIIFIYEVYKVMTEPDGHRWGDELAGTRVVEV